MLQIDVLLNIFVALRTYWLLLFSALQIQLILILCNVYLHFIQKALIFNKLNVLYIRKLITDS